VKDGLLGRRQRGAAAAWSCVGISYSVTNFLIEQIGGVLDTSGFFCRQLLGGSDGQRPCATTFVTTAFCGGESGSSGEVERAGRHRSRRGGIELDLGVGDRIGVAGSSCAMASLMATHGCCRCGICRHGGSLRDQVGRQALGSW